MSINVRVRGIYATALSALLPKLGFQVVGASPPIAERLGLSSAGDAEVRLRDRPDHQAIWLDGPHPACAALAAALAHHLPDAAPRALADGPAVYELELPGGCKRQLDRARAEVWPTLPGHHQLKIVANEAVERAEQQLAAGRAEAEQLAADLRQRFVLGALRPGRELAIEHVKPGGRAIRLRGRLRQRDGGRLLISRTFRPGGTFDSLAAPKLAGDHGEVEQLEGSWVSRRRYLRADGTPIGELYNIQTPTELYPTGVRYLDLEVDVAAWPDGRVAVVDLDELEDAIAAGYLPAALAERAWAVAEEVAATLAGGARVELDDWC